MKPTSEELAKDVLSKKKVQTGAFLGLSVSY